ncbi:MAG: tail fiber domain-containing protein [Defluviitaleaceae bacterium]|nr:tail fiber domain-containing protein [Defluviitaleaceae bacterium]
MARNQQIRDRVAFGDDLFRMENQADGRVRLVPAPNEVPTQGTDVNAALMQPWEDMHTAATSDGLIRLGRDADGIPELTIPQLDSLSSAVVSTTAASVAAKTVVLPGFVRRRGSTVWVRFTAANTALSPTLNINNTGAASIQLNGVMLDDGNLARQVAADVLYGFVFDGTAWQMVITGSNLPTMGQGLGAVNTAAATVAKIGTIVGFTRRTGSLVWLRFTNRNTAVQPTLNVNSTGAAAIFFNGDVLPEGAIAAGGVYGFVFDGVSWQILNPFHTHNAADITDGRLIPARLPTTTVANLVLAVQTANTDPAFVRINDAMIANDAVRTAHIQNLNVTTAKIADWAVNSAKIADLAVNNAKITNNTIRQAKLHVVEGFAELGLSNNATLLDVITAIRALPMTRPVSVRINITTFAIAAALQAPLHDIDSMMLIERAWNNANMLLLTCYTGLSTTGRLRTFTANFQNIVPNAERLAAIVWREIPQLNNGRLTLGQLPTGDANRVLAIGASAHSGPSFMQVNSAMMGNSAIWTSHLQNGSVTADKIANLSVTSVKIADSAVTAAKIADSAVMNAKIANNTIRQEKLHVMDGYVELGLPIGAPLHDVINAIRALPMTRPVSVRITITSSHIARELRAPLAINGMMQIERVQNTSNWLMLTYYPTLSTNNMLIFTASHPNSVATISNTEAIVWREILQLNEGRIGMGHLPTSTIANTVLRVGQANGVPGWGQVNLNTDVTGTLPVANGGTGGILPVTSGGTGATTVEAARISLGANNAENLTTGTIPIGRIGIGAVDTARIADNAITAEKIANMAVLDNHGRIAMGRNASVAGGVSNVAIGENAQISWGTNNIALGIDARITDGRRNIAIGDNAHAAGPGAGDNIALGHAATASQGRENTAIGMGARVSQGTHSISLGPSAVVNAAGSQGSVVIGRSSHVTHVHAALLTPNVNFGQRNSHSNNSVILGNSDTTVGGWGAWNNLSDARDKRDISPLAYNPLTFISALKPKQYRTDYRSNYRCFQEISEAEFKALGEYDKRHRIHETDVYSIDGTDIEWIDDPCILTNNGRINDIKDVPDFPGKAESPDRYDTKYLSSYAKGKEAAKQKFNNDKCLKLPTVAKAWKLFCKEHGAKAEADLFIDSRVKKTRKARFLMIELEPDGTYAGRRYHWGFMAQEVEQAAKGMGIDCPAVQYLAHNKDKDGVPEGDDLYTMGYTELIAPLVGAVQQLTDMVQQLQAEIVTLKNISNKTA